MSEQERKLVQDRRRLLSVIRGRLHRRGREAEGGEREDGEREDEYIDIDPRDLNERLRGPGWFRDLGLTAWLFVGMGLLLVGLDPGLWR